MQSFSIRHSLAMVYCIVAVPFVGCGQATSPDLGQTESRTIDSSSTAFADSGDSIQTGESAKQLQQKLKFKIGDGEPGFSIKPESDGGKLIDSNESELARFKLQEGKLKIKLPDETVVAYIVPSAGKLKVKDPTQAVELWTLRAQDDGDWKLEDGEDKLIYKIKKRDYGFEIEDGFEKSLAKSKRKGDKTSLRDPDEQTLFYTKDPIKPESLACLGFDSISEMSIRTGLLLMVEIGAAESK